MSITKEVSSFEDGGVWLRGDLLGQGSFGSVHLAHFSSDSLPRRYQNIPSLVAVKSADSFSSQSLVSEKSIFDALGNSPFLIRCFGDDETTSSSGHSYYNLFIEYASGGSLWDLIKNNNGVGLLESQVKFLTLTILAGLYHIHKAGYTHCDIKPENVFLVKEGELGCVGKIGDFGLTTFGANKSVKGTRMYLAPECLEQRIQGQSSDVWALGCVVFSMLTGTLEWDLEPDIVDLLSHHFKTGGERISGEAVDFVWKCLTVDPKDRPTAGILMTHPFLMRYSDDRDCI